MLFAEVLPHLPKGARVAVNLPDTLVLEDCESGRVPNVRQWLFTAKRTGVVMKKADKNIRPNPVEKAIEAFCLALSDRPTCDPLSQVAAHIHYKSGKRRRVTLAELEVATSSTLFSEDAVLFQQAVPDACPGLDISCKYRLDNNGMTFSSKVQCKDKSAVPPELKRAVNDVATAVAKRLASVCKITVTKMKLLFVRDSKDDVWLSNISSIETKEEKSSKNNSYYQQEEKTHGDNVNNMVPAAIPSSSSSPPPLHQAQLAASPTNESSFKHESIVAKPRERRCAGEFCSFNPERECQWQTQEMGLNSPSLRHGDDEGLHDSYNCSFHVPTPEAQLHSISQRSVVLARNVEDSQRFMDALLRCWVKRREASKTRLKSIAVTVKGVRLNRNVQVVRQDHQLEIQWDWTGKVTYVDVILAPIEAAAKAAEYDPGKVIQEPMLLAHGCRNVGRAKIHIPVVNDQWASNFSFWTILVVDCHDSLVEGVSPCFLLGGKSPKEIPAVHDPASFEVPPHLDARATKLASADDKHSVYAQTGAKDAEAVQMINLGSYHRKAKVCENCLHVYLALDSARLEHREQEELEDEAGELLKEKWSSTKKQQDPFLSYGLPGKTRERTKRQAAKGATTRSAKEVSAPLLPHIVPATVKDAQEAQETTGLGQSANRKTASPGLFNRLSEPKKYEHDYAPQQSWGAGFSLRKAKQKTPCTSKEKRACKLQQQQQQRRRQEKRAGNQTTETTTKRRKRSPSGSKTSAPMQRRSTIKTHKKHAKEPREQLLASWSDTEEQLDEAEQHELLDWQHQTKPSRQKKQMNRTILKDAQALSDHLEQQEQRERRRVKKKTPQLPKMKKRSGVNRYLLESPSRIFESGAGAGWHEPKCSPVQRTSDEEPLDIGAVEPGSDLHQVLCLLSLGQLEDCKMMVKLVDKRGLASLAFSKVDGGRIKVRSESARSKSPLKKPPTFVEILNRTKRGRQTLALLSEHLSICHMFCVAVDPKSIGLKSDSAIQNRKRLMVSRLENAIQSLERFCEVHKMALPRLLIMKGLLSSLAGKKQLAFESWREAIAAAARLEGMWSYNVGISHFLLGKHSCQDGGDTKGAGDDSFRQSHLAAAAAIFSRLKEVTELGIVNKEQLALSNGSQREQMRQHMHALPHTPGAFDRSHVESSVKRAVKGRKRNDFEKEDLLAAAQAMLQDIKNKLSNNGLGQEQVVHLSENIVNQYRELEQTMEGAESDIDIFASTSPSHKHFAHRKSRVQRSLDDVALKCNALMDLAALEQSNKSALDMMQVSTPYSRNGTSNSTVREDSEFYTSTPRGSSLFGSNEFTPNKSDNDKTDGDSGDDDDDDIEYSSDEYEDEEEGDDDDDDREEEGNGDQTNQFLTFEQKYMTRASKSVLSSTDELFAACYSKNLMEMKQLLRKWTEESDKAATLAVDNQGNTLLHVAAFGNWIQGIHTCLSSGIDIDSKNIEGNTALHLARENGNSTAETLLIALGACEDVKNIYNLTYKQGARF